ncbi:RNA-dependent RNA polymerase [Xapuri virus]|uniref:RNA-directed RNA polymerase L n=1 Tax=Xapuri virus TaxID=2267561 RepID=A0A2Z5DEQ8_9VIRU|nr:RNA-dependent RNA polymerase [Xapuri virus]AXB49214.1 RNA-dependent RNA polymerase [Xapuri virus]
MDETIINLKDLVRKYIPDLPEITLQKELLLSQQQVDMILTEGFKLLALIVELESAYSNNCTPNHEGMTVEQILRDNKVLTPSLPKLIPDGYNLLGETLILLETFVRVDSVSFEQKWKSDMAKLLCLKDDLARAGITLVPIVDGRTNYYNRFVPDWVTERFRWLMLNLVKGSRGSNIEIEEQEYKRLVHSLSKFENQSLGFENISTMQETGLEYRDKLRAVLLKGVDNKMRDSKVKERLLSLRLWYKHNVHDKGASKYKWTNKEELLQELEKLSSRSEHLNNRCHICSNRVFEICHNIVKFMGRFELETEERESNPGMICTKYLSLLSVCNKIKGSKVLNTRRNTLLYLDNVIINFLINEMIDNPSTIQVLKREGLIIGRLLTFANDRCFSVELSYNLIKRKFRFCPNWLTSCSKILSEEMPELYKVIKPFASKPDTEGLLKLISGLGDDPIIMNYKRDPQLVCTHENGNLNLNNDLFNYLKVLSGISLGMINSLKTSFSSRMIVNEQDASNFYGKVNLKEAYVQRFFLEDGVIGLLFYQKTGEKSRCYSIYLSTKQGLEYMGSFYADPKRYFLPIFSEGVLISMVDEMVGWLDFCPELQQEVSPMLNELLISILCSPSKRNQVFMQGLRYLVMAYVNQIHHVELMSKLEVKCASSADMSVQILASKLVMKVLDNKNGEHLTRRFKFCLNVSYLCHLITKETPDRLTDQIKCFEKFLEPKCKFESLIVNPTLDQQLTETEEDEVLRGLEKLLGKESECIEDISEPGISREILSMCLSCFNNGKLSVNGKLRSDPYKPSFTSTALDMSSNKSVVIPKLDELGNIISTYDYETMVSSCIVKMTEYFKTKGKYCVEMAHIDHLIYKNLSNLVSCGKSSELQEADDLSLLYESLTEEQISVFNQLKEEVIRTMSKMNDSHKNDQKKTASDDQAADPGWLMNLWSDLGVCRKIKQETSIHEIRDFDPQLIEEDVLKTMITRVYCSSKSSDFFLEDVVNPCPLDMLLRNGCTASFNEGDYFQCFKYILIISGFDQRLGSYEHRNKSRLGLKREALQVSEKARVSVRESNSEAIAKRLDKSFFTNSALRNLCFYTDESPTSFGPAGSDVGKLKFGLSYKEQVGSNRELYVGDLNTKLMTRLIEDFSQSVTDNMNFSCLNSEKEFEKAIGEMKMAVNLGDLCYSMDHSKWGPHMSPAIFYSFMMGLNLVDTKCSKPIDIKPIISILSWHIHKVVEVPFNVAQAYLTGLLKRDLGLMHSDSFNITESFMHRFMRERREIPSHIMSVLDMGQGILHNTSDLYGLITEQFINYALDFLYDVVPCSYTSSDDEILVLKMPTNTTSEEELKEMTLELIGFHDFLSSKLNKFISPKSVVGSFAAEFKSRFFVLGEEVPLLTKFVAASLHNIKCKTPIQLAETIDTICDQSVANGVSVSIIEKISERVNKLIKYSGFPGCPFLAVEKQDVKDWVDGTRSYRLQRNIEYFLEKTELTKSVRSICYKIFQKVKSGQISEHCLVSLVGNDGDKAFKGFLDSVGTTVNEIERFLEPRWLNLSTYGNLRLVLRTKIMTSKRLLEREEIPNLIKSLQSKLSKNFTRGAKKILAESINKSAFQSSIASGFIGFCKSMGSKCVRDGSGNFLYIKDLTRKITKCDCDVCGFWPGVLFCKRAIESVSNYSRPILWDYFSILLCNACELGEWVFSDPREPQMRRFLNNRNLFWAIKPKVPNKVQERIGMNHVLQSVKRNYPHIYDEHLTPYLSEIQVGKLISSLSIRFLDICVALDMVNESLGIVAHILNDKREELYIVKQDECSMSHIREADYIDKDLGLSSQQICYNFKVQLLFSSMIQPLVLTTSTLKNFYWFGEALRIEDSTELDLGELTNFAVLIRDCGVERGMIMEDLSLGYIVSDISEPVLSVNHTVLMQQLDWGLLKNETELKALFETSRSDTVLFEFVLQITHTRTSTRFNLKRRVVYTMKFKVFMKVDKIHSEEKVWKVDDLELFVTGAGNNHFILDAAPQLSMEPLILGKKTFDLAELLSNQELNVKDDEALFGNISFDFGDHINTISNKFSYILTGPDVSDNPLIYDAGQFKQDNVVLSTMKVAILGNSILKAMTTLESKQERFKLFSGILRYSIKTKQIIDITQEEFLDLRQQYQSEVIESFKEIKDWIEFTSYKLCYSQHYDDLVVSDTSGRVRLRGVLCRRLTEGSVVDID